MPDWNRDRNEGLERGPRGDVVRTEREPREYARSPWDRESSGERGPAFGYEYDRAYEREPRREGVWDRLKGGHVGKGPKGYRRSDERIHEEVCEQLAQHPDVDASDVEVEVRDGEVTLRGTIEDRWMKRLAGDAIESLSGVRDVHNQIRVMDRGAATAHGQGLTGTAGGTLPPGGLAETARLKALGGTPSGRRQDRSTPRATSTRKPPRM